jgi:hypothetical protein
MVAYNFNQRDLKIRLTMHALIRLAERGITEADVEDMVHTGTRRREAGAGERGGEMWLFFKTLRGRPMVAVTEVLQPNCFVLTVKAA